MYKNKPENIEKDYGTEEFKFFWRSDPDPWSEKYNATWSPYVEGDNIFLEEQYQIYLEKVKNGKEPQMTTLGNPPQYRIDFKNWVQININESSKQRAIIRSLPSNVYHFFLRVHRFDSEIMPSKEQAIDILKNNEINQAKQESIVIKFDIIKDKEVEIQISKRIFEFIESKGIIKDYNKWVVSLKDEINNLEKISTFRNSENKYYYAKYLEKIENSNFYETMITMYTVEDYLYKEINKVLREAHKNELQQISCYYISLMASLEYYTQRTFENLLNKKILNENVDTMMVYRGAPMTKEELETYDKLLSDKSVLKVRQIFQFLSTSIKKETTTMFLQPEKDKIKALYFIEIPIFKDDYKSCPITYIKDFSIYKNEEECLIKSGTLLLIEKITKINENLYNVFMRAVKRSTKGFYYFLVEELKKKRLEEVDLRGNNLGRQKIEEFSYFFDNLLSIKTLNLGGNDFGRGKVENMEKLSEAIMNNKTIITLDLRENDFGEGKVANSAQLAEALMNNGSITTLDLFWNNFGFGNVENIANLSESLIYNKSITTLNLCYNNFGKGKVENISKLAEALMNNNSITSLDLSKNDFGFGKVENMRNLAEALMNNKSIITLDLSENDFGTGEIKNMEKLSEALMNNKSITTLYLGANDLGSGKIENMEKLSEALMNNKTITTLDLKHNGFGYGKTKNTSKLVEALMNNKSITTLVLTGNDIQKGLLSYGILLPLFNLNNQIKIIL